MDYTPFGTSVLPDYHGDDQPQGREELEEYWRYVDRQLRERDQLHDTNQRKDGFKDV